MKFNEDSRVKIPSIMHLTRLGYKYISLKTAKWNLETNIFTDIFEEAGPRFTPFHGGFGLLNSQGLNKLAFYSFKFINQYFWAICVMVHISIT